MTKEILDGINYIYNSRTGRKKKIKPIVMPKIMSYCERCGKKIYYMMVCSSVCFPFTNLCKECDEELYNKYTPESISNPTEEQKSIWSKIFG